MLPEVIRKVLSTGSNSKVVQKDLGNLDLRAAQLAGMTFVQCSFVGSDLEGANFRGAKLHQCRMWECNLRGTDFSGADILQTDFVKPVWSN